MNSVNTKLWIDIANPSDALFFKALLSELSEYKTHITTRKRAETVELVNSFNIKSQIIGRDYNDPIKKSLNTIYRAINLALKVPKFNASLSFENGMAVFASRMRLKPSILYRDNDLELSQRTFVKSIETKIKARANYTITPSAYIAEGLIKEGAKKENIFQFDGYKEDVYIADYKPDPNFKDKIPYEAFVVLRPEALGSFYVKEMKSIVPELLASFIKEGMNVVYIPREKEDVKYADGMDVFVPKKALNGLDLCYCADAILTGSGTLAREAACMDTPAVSFFPSEVLLSVDQQLAPAVSFFPSEVLLSVDQQLVDEGKIFHSRDIEEIVDYVRSQHKKNKKMDLERCKKVKREVIMITKEILKEIEVK
jgi:predicted glycosyltransferase